jgi:hypothetical protein
MSKISKIPSLIHDKKNWIMNIMPKNTIHPSQNGIIANGKVISNKIVTTNTILKKI